MPLAQSVAAANERVMRLKAELAQTEATLGSMQGEQKLNEACIKDLTDALDALRADSTEVEYQKVLNLV